MKSRNKNPKVKLAKKSATSKTPGVEPTPRGRWRAPPWVAWSLFWFLAGAGSMTWDGVIRIQPAALPTHHAR